MAAISINAGTMAHHAGSRAHGVANEQASEPSVSAAAEMKAGDSARSEKVARLMAITRASTTTDGTLRRKTDHSPPRLGWSEDSGLPVGREVADGTFQRYRRRTLAQNLRLARPIP